MHLEGKVLSLRKQFRFCGSANEEFGNNKEETRKLVGEEFWV